MISVLLGAECYEESAGEWSRVSVQSESESNVLALMVALMFYCNHPNMQDTF